MSARSKQQSDLRVRFEEIVRDDCHLVQLLGAARELALPQWRVVAGCLYQTVWNVLTNKPPLTGIKDYDLIYFDDTDLSWEAEHLVIERVNACTAHFPVPVETRNQARVHLWFKQRFGTDYAPLRCADDALERYASVVHAVGVRLEADGRLDIIAPFGLTDLFEMVIRPNKVIDNRMSHMAKGARAKAIWPEVVVVPWSDGLQ